MSRRKQRSVVVLSNEIMTITRHYGRGKKDPSALSVEMHQPAGGAGHRWQDRRIKLTMDELYDLTEALDDLCDLIEDQITEHHKEHVCPCHSGAARKGVCDDCKGMNCPVAELLKKE